ncbi:MAG TPA: bifunctional helix-turn-helix transcriptional regulator/GNAT family N-acetyltransferase [Longimicrobium sp.]|nr:bifunctional helix-turn-helix transcriptional regulator/GNAT family N-acetyltransferase [Longimicrobium sp.]
MTATPSLDEQVAAVRRFNRFYTRRIGVLDEGHLHSGFSLAEVRVLWELAHRRDPTATELGRDLALDAGYLSRMLRGFESRGMMERVASPADARVQLLRLTEQGRETFAGLNESARADVAALLQPLGDDERLRLVAALGTVEALLEPRAEPGPPYLLRPPRAGDYGWVVQRHGVLYAREYGWDERFEALVAEVIAGFVRNWDPAWERCWIAERGGENVGCVFVVRKSETVAQLRLLLVEPSARGLGVGKRLVRECTEFAREKGYRSIVLWTNSVLDAARHIYQAEGYRLTSEETHDSFGTDLVGQYWEMDL